MIKATIITGVAGTTGSMILDYLAESSKEVKNCERVIVGYDNFFRGIKENIEKHLNEKYFEFIEDNYRYIPEVMSETRLFSFKGVPVEVDEIYHMAAIVPTRYFYEAPELTFEVNCKGTVDLFNWAKDVGVKRFVVGSTSEVYGHIKDEDIPAKETTMSHFDSVEDSTRWSYAEGKLLTEHILNQSKDKIKVCHLRFANTYGSRDLDDNHIIPYIINCVIDNRDMRINKEPFDYFRTFLNNHDSARACVEVMEHGRSGVAYNVGSQKEVSIYELVKTILFIAEDRYGITYSGNIYKVIDRPGDPRRRVLDTTRLYEDTGFKPEVSLNDGIIEMFNAVIDKRSRKN